MIKDVEKYIDVVDLQTWIEYFDALYTERFTMPGFYEAYHKVCAKHNVTTALLPHREYRQLVTK